MSGVGERAFRNEKSSRDDKEILEAAMRRTARSGGVFGMLHRTTVPGADLIEGIVDSVTSLRGGYSERVREQAAWQASDPPT